MSAAVLSIGTELTRGEIVNTNASWLAGRLTALGFEVLAIDTVDDERDRIVAALRRLAASHRVIVCTGGLGPTTDDITAASVAQALGVSLTRHEPSIEAIRRRFEKTGRVMSESNAKQADLPDGAEVLANAVGTAPGFAVSVGEARAFFLPGVPFEVERMWDEQVEPRLRPLAVRKSHQIRLKTFGLPESVVGERLAGLEGEKNPGLTIGYRASQPEIEVKILVRGESEEAARQIAHAAAEEAKLRLGDAVYGEGDDTLPEALARAIRARGWRLAIAESLTGGLVGHLITAVPASEFFVADAVTYANSAKTRLLGVNEDVLRGYGAVSAEVAAAMAEGIRRVCEADIALAVTGLAGPHGGTPEMPVGQCYWAVSHPGGTLIEQRVLPGERRQIQRIAAFVGMSLLRQVCLADERRTPSPGRVSGAILGGEGAGGVGRVRGAPLHCREEATGPPGGGLIYRHDAAFRQETEPICKGRRHGRERSWPERRISQPTEAPTRGPSRSLPVMEGGPSILVEPRGPHQGALPLPAGDGGGPLDPCRTARPPPGGPLAPCR